MLIGKRSKTYHVANSSPHPGDRAILNLEDEASLSSCAYLLQHKLAVKSLYAIGIVI